MRKITLVTLFILSAISCNGTVTANGIQTGAERTEEYLPLLKGKKVGLVVNPTSRIGNTHLVDSLKHLGVQVVRIFAPEHGFRGEAANGEHVSGGVDLKTGLEVISLYGKHVKPTEADLKGLDLLVFDIQDVGVRYYTFLSTLHYVMQACAEQKKELIVLDRPNPNGYYVDGPVLKDGFQSMVGLHPIPLVHGMTLGELALMINGEGWLKTKDTCKLKVVTCKNWHHNKPYILPVPPSPNLPTTESIILYPSLGLLEGTPMSMGRGTQKPFECFGAPWLKVGSYYFVPQDIPGKAINPPFKGDTCRGILLTDFAKNYLVSFSHVYVEWLVLLYKETPQPETFFTPFFDKLAGSDQLKKMIKEGKSANEIRLSWKNDIDLFLNQRAPYMLYPFEMNLGQFE